MKEALHPHAAVSPDKWPVGEGEMYERIRKFDWASTSLGPIEHWPEFFRTAVSLILASPRVATLACGPERLLIYNDAAAAIYNSRHPQALGRPLAETFADNYPDVSALYDRAFRGETVQVREQPLDIGAGEIFDATLSPVRNPRGEIAAVHMIGFEVSGRLKAEAALRDSEERYRAFVTASSDVVYRMSPDWTEMRELDGRSFLADAPEPTTGWMDHYIDPTDWPTVKAAIDQAIANKSMFELEHRVVRVDGSFGWTSSRAVPILDERGDIAEWLGTARDVTEKRRAEEALRESEERFRVLADNMAQLAWTCDKLGNVTWYNERWLDYTGLTFDDMKGWDWSKVQHPDHVDRVVRKVQQSAETGEPWEDTFPLRGRDGTYRWFLSRAVPLRNLAGEIVSWFGTNTDVTEAMLTENALRESERHAKLLLAELQHRVRNTLAIVRSIAQRTAENSSSVDELLGHFRGRLDAFSRVQAALTRSVGGMVSLISLIEDELVAHAAREGEQVSIEGPDIMLEPKTAERLSLAIHELTTNAVKHGALTSGEGRIQVRWKRKQTNGSARLLFNWRESGVEIDETPEWEGFGMELLLRSLPYDLQAETTVALRCQGLEFDLDMPLREPAKVG